MFDSVTVPQRQSASRLAKVILAASLALPIVCMLISAFADAPGPHIPYFDPNGARYLDLFTVLAILSSLALLIPGMVSAYKCLGTWAAVATAVWNIAVIIVCLNHVTWS